MMCLNNCKKDDMISTKQTNEHKRKKIASLALKRGPRIHNGHIIIFNFSFTFTNVLLPEKSIIYLVPN